MKEEIKNLWVEALRSGKYKQGKRQLKNSNNEFCCLGVLCDISKQGEWNGNYFNENVTFLPSIIQKWSGIHTSDVKCGKSYLSELNDKGYSFEQIADIIEQHWKEI